MQIRMLREIDAMFEGVPQSRRTLEVKEELLRSVMEQYYDLVSRGKSEEAAFNLALASIGDISSLRAELMDQEIPQVARFNGAQSGQDVQLQAPVDPRHHRASVVAVAVMMYILSPVPVILFGGGMGILLLFTLIAAATGLLIYNGMISGSGLSNQAQSKPKNSDVDGRMSKKQRHFVGSLSSALWMATLALYFVISFRTGAWYISWIIFLIAAAANNVMKAFVDLYRE